MSQKTKAVNWKWLFPDETYILEWKERDISLVIRQQEVSTNEAKQCV